jgi:DNA-binding MarR family transcriptional regulator
MAKPVRTKEVEVAELLSAMGQLVRRLRAEAKSGELGWNQMSVLARLDAEPMTTADLARAETMKPQSMGTLLAQMEDEGLVRRKPHPTDGRQILCELTAAGREGRYKSRLAKREWLLAAISKLDQEEQQSLFAATEVIRQIAES